LGQQITAADLSGATLFLQVITAHLLFSGSIAFIYGKVIFTRLAIAGGNGLM
jgi:hypothetical protein